MNRLPKDRALGPDGITDEVIYIVAPLILKKLAQAVIGYLAIGLPKELKKSFTLVPKKEGKKNYSLLSTYRLIALKNTLVKLVEKILTMYIAGKAEAETLLPWN